MYLSSIWAGKVGIRRIENVSYVSQPPRAGYVVSQMYRRTRYVSQPARAGYIVSWMYCVRIHVSRRITDVSSGLTGYMYCARQDTMCRVCISYVSWAKSVIRSRYIRIHTIHMYRLKIHVSRRGYSKIPLDTSTDTYPSEILHNTRKIHQQYVLREKVPKSEGKSTTSRM